jgi:xanthine dehydrogenase accessory factor
MFNNDYLARVICELLENGSPIVLASIVMLEGSSPRHNGAKMVVAANGKSYGTIGGSLLEATAIKEAWSAIAAAKSRILDFNLNGKDANSMGMICGGKTSVLLDYIAATPANREFFLSWQKARQGSRDFYFVTYTRGSKNALKVYAHSFVYADGEVTSTGKVSEEDKELLNSELRHINMTTVIENEGTRLIIDPIRKVKTVYLFGAGHVAVPTAHIASLTGFRTIVLDDRAEFARSDRFPNVYTVRLLPSFDQALDGLEIDSDSLIVIFTRGHQFDRAVLEQSLKTRAGYIGMISSSRKRDTIYKALLEKGVSQSELDRVHSPIGIAIGGETPEEIAVSIVAELISERNKSQS